MSNDIPSRRNYNISSFSKLQYRNAVYQGMIYQRNREGFGILITDSIQVFIANWKKNIIHGKYIYIDQNLKAFGTMKEGKLQGYNMIKIQNMSIYGKFHENILDGNIIFKNGDKFKVVNYLNGVMIKQCISSQLNNKSKFYFQQIFKKQFPFNQSKILDFFNQFLLETQFTNIKQFKQIILSEAYRYFGFVNQFNEGEGLGCVIKIDGSLYSCGTYSNTQLNGLGHMIPNQSQIFDGVFKNNIVKGIGIKYNRSRDQYIIGIHNKQNNYQKKLGKLDLQQEEMVIQKGDPLYCIKQIRKQFHLRSLDFCDQIIVMNLLIKIKTEDQIQKDKFLVRKYVDLNKKSDSIKGKKKTNYNNKIDNDDSKKIKLVQLKQKKIYYIEEHLANSVDSSECGDSQSEKIRRQKSQSKKSPKNQDQMSRKLINNKQFFQKVKKTHPQKHLEIIINQPEDNKHKLKQPIKQNYQMNRSQQITNYILIPKSTKSQTFNLTNLKINQNQNVNSVDVNKLQGLRTGMKMEKISKELIFGKKSQKTNMESNQFCIKLKQVQIEDNLKNEVHKQRKDLNFRNRYIEYKLQNKKTKYSKNKNILGQKKQKPKSMSKSNKKLTPTNKKKFDLFSIYKQMNISQFNT